MTLKKQIEQLKMYAAIDREIAQRSANVFMRCAPTSTAEQKLRVACVELGLNPNGIYSE
jgi:hypothetical protein